MSNKKNKLQGYDTLVSTFVLLSNLSEKEVLNKLDKMDKVQVKSIRHHKGQLVLDIEYDAYWASCWFDTVSENIRVLSYQKCIKALILSILNSFLNNTLTW